MAWHQRNCKYCLEMAISCHSIMSGWTLKRYLTSFFFMVRVSLFKSIDNYSEKMTAKNLEIETCGQVEFSILSSKNTDSVFDKFCCPLNYTSVTLSCEYNIFNCVYICKWQIINYILWQNWKFYYWPAAASRWNMTYIDEKLYDSWLTEMVKRLVTSSTSSSNWIFEMLVSTDDGDVYCISLIHNGLDLDFYLLVQYLTISIITKLKFSLNKLALVKSNLKHIQFLKLWMYLFHFMHSILLT